MICDAFYLIDGVDVFVIVSKESHAKATFTLHLIRFPRTNQNLLIETSNSEVESIGITPYKCAPTFAAKTSVYFWRCAIFNVCVFCKPFEFRRIDEVPWNGEASTGFSALRTLTVLRL